MHKKNSKKAVALLVSLALLLVVAVGSTIAFLIDVTNPVVNTFDPSKVTVEVNETFDGNTKTNVSIKNTGDTTAYIRAAVVITWQNEQGDVYGKMPVANTDYTVDWNKTDWIEDANGFYYWKLPVAAGGNTGILIDSIEPVDGAAPEGYFLCVEILASGIQSEPDKVVNEAWQVVKVDTDSTTLVKIS